MNSGVVIDKGEVLALQWCVSGTHLGLENELCFCLVSTFSLIRDCIINSVSVEGQPGNPLLLSRDRAIVRFVGSH
jgi:hypothetical protein